MEKQKTIKKEVRVKGTGIHTGKKAQLIFKPAQENSGITFIRTDLPERPKVKAGVANVLEKGLKMRRTSLGNGKAEIHTVEHLLSALFGLGVDNVNIEIDSEEIPALGGSALDYYNLLKEAGVVDLDIPKRTLSVHEPIWVKEDDSFLALFPDKEFRISYTLSYPKSELNQYLNVVVNESTFTKELAPCKTFCLENEVEHLRAQGLGKGATQENTIVVGKKGVVEGRPTFSDECARHKVLDLIGDLCLLTTSIKGHLVAVKSGHTLNIKFLKRLYGMMGSSAPAKTVVPALSNVVPPFDIQKIMQVLPHRYPFLLVDKVLEFEEGKRILAVKNVTVNEQFFTGHFPGRPIMPGVLIVEAMAQAAGILMLSRQEHRGKLAFFMSMDKVKFRKTVVPGDQLLLDASVLKIKSRTIQISGKAIVDGKVVTEAEMMFSLIPKND